MSVTGTGCRGFWSIGTRHSFFFDDPESCRAIKRHRACCGSLPILATLKDDHWFSLWQHRSARHGAFEPRMPREKRNVLANTPASSQPRASLHVPRFFFFRPKCFFFYWIHGSSQHHSDVACVGLRQKLRQKKRCHHQPKRSKTRAIKHNRKRSQAITQQPSRESH